ncbi:MAG: hypothetical protein KA313_08790 [Pseudarcicella sp.]|nr:hypothetical protein [Pseudarcicella sp.]MBP6411180.1 hypothetical protein [Pseudarcicella sp.]
MTFKKVFGKHNYLITNSFSKKELETYDKYWDSISSERTLISSAEREGLEKGEKIGLEKGEKIGFEKAQQQFLEEEKAKNLELNKNIILNMHKEGFNELIIQKITGLDIIFIQEILNNNKI